MEDAISRWANDLCRSNLPDMRFPWGGPGSGTVLRSPDEACGKSPLVLLGVRYGSITGPSNNQSSGTVSGVSNLYCYIGYYIVIWEDRQ